MSTKNYVKPKIKVSSNLTRTNVLRRELGYLNFYNSKIGDNSIALTSEDLFISIGIEFNISDNYKLINNFHYQSQNAILDYSSNKWYEDYYQLKLVNNKEPNSTTTYYIDGRVSYKWDGSFQLQMFYNILTSNSDGSTKLYAKEIKQDNFNGTPLVINADREYRITFTEANVTLSSLKLKFDTNQEG